MNNPRLSNNRMNLTRSAPQTDRRGPCRLSACSTLFVGISRRIALDERPSFG